VLRDTSTGKPLWRALGSGSADLPGRLTVQEDGDLVLRDRFSCVIWSSGTGGPTGAPSTLSLEGSRADGTLRLIVHDYANGRTTATLYP
jgi:L-asparaginase